MKEKVQELVGRITDSNYEQTKLEKNFRQVVTEMVEALQEDEVMRHIENAKIEINPASGNGLHGTGLEVKVRMSECPDTHGIGERRPFSFEYEVPANEVYPTHPDNDGDEESE